MLRICGCVFCFCLFCLYFCVCVYLQIEGPLREYCSIWLGTSLLPYYCTPLVCVPDVIGLIAVWRNNKPKNQKKVLFLYHDLNLQRHDTTPSVLMLLLSGLASCLPTVGVGRSTPGAIAEATNVETGNPACSACFGTPSFVCFNCSQLSIFEPASHEPTLANRRFEFSCRQDNRQ